MGKVNNTANSIYPVSLFFRSFEELDLFILNYFEKE